MICLYLVNEGYLFVNSLIVKCWDLVWDNMVVNDFLDFDVWIFFNYLEYLNDFYEDFWLVWLENNLDFVDEFWLVIVDLVVLGEYLIMLDLFCVVEWGDYFKGLCWVFVSICFDYFLLKVKLF